MIYDNPTYICDEIEQLSCLCFSLCPIFDVGTLGAWIICALSLNYAVWHLPNKRPTSSSPELHLQPTVATNRCFIYNVEQPCVCVRGVTDLIQTMLSLACSCAAYPFINSSMSDETKAPHPLVIKPVLVGHFSPGRHFAHKHTLSLRGWRWASEPTFISTLSDCTDCFIISPIDICKRYFDGCCEFESKPCKNCLNSIRTIT